VDHSATYMCRQTAKTLLYRATSCSLGISDCTGRAQRRLQICRFDSVCGPSPYTLPHGVPGASSLWRQPGRRDPVEADKASHLCSKARVELTTDLSSGCGCQGGWCKGEWPLLEAPFAGDTGELLETLVNVSEECRYHMPLSHGKMHGKMQSEPVRSRALSQLRQCAVQRGEPAASKSTEAAERGQGWMSGLSCPTGASAAQKPRREVPPRMLWCPWLAADSRFGPAPSHPTTGV